MNKRRSCRITALILTVAAILLLGVGIYLLTRPISYGMSYYHASVYDSDDFNGSMTFYADNSMLVRNTNFGEEMKSLYYYKDGYIFFALAQTQEAYEEEVAAINKDFEGAVNTPFYASRINAFTLTSDGPDGYRSVYTCTQMVYVAIIGGIVELALMALAVYFWIRSGKPTYEKP